MRNFILEGHEIWSVARVFRAENPLEALRLHRVGAEPRSVEMLAYEGLTEQPLFLREVTEKGEVISEWSADQITRLAQIDSSISEAPPMPPGIRMAPNAFAQQMERVAQGKEPVPDWLIAQIELKKSEYLPKPPLMPVPPEVKLESRLAGTIYRIEQLEEQIKQMDLAFHEALKRQHQMIEALQRMRPAPQLSDSQALTLIQEALSVENWSPDTLDDIAELVRLTGRPITESEEEEVTDEVATGGPDGSE